MPNTTPWSNAIKSWLNTNKESLGNYSLGDSGQVNSLMARMMDETKVNQYVSPRGQNTIRDNFKRALANYTTQSLADTMAGKQTAQPFDAANYQPYGSATEFLSGYAQNAGKSASYSNPFQQGENTRNLLKSMADYKPNDVNTTPQDYAKRALYSDTALQNQLLASSLGRYAGSGRGPQVFKEMQRQLALTSDPLNPQYQGGNWFQRLLDMYSKYNPAR
jgi:hypothetical protein